MGEYQVKKHWQNYVEWVPNAPRKVEKNPVSNVDRVVHIIIDGIPADFYYNNQLQNLSVLQNDGHIFTKCLSIWPTLTGPAHTSMNSGALPARTGVNLNQFYNFKTKKLEHINPLAVSKAESIAEALFKSSLKSAGICGHMHRSLQYFVSEALVGHDAKLVTDFAINALNKFPLDYLQVVYFTVDTVQHHYGAKSKEALEAFRWVDKEIGRLLKRIEQDKERTVIVLTADHGQDLIKKDISKKLSTIVNKCEFEVYGYGRFAVLQGKANEKSRNLLEENLSLTPFCKKVLWEEDLYQLGVDPKQIGASVVLLNSGFTTGGDYKGNHGSFTRDEALVPLVFYGDEIKQGESDNVHEIIDIAPTICHLLGVDKLLNNQGRILTEILSKPSNNYEDRRLMTLLEFII